MWQSFLFHRCPFWSTLFQSNVPLRSLRILHPINCLSFIDFTCKVSRGGALLSAQSLWSSSSGPKVDGKFLWNICVKCNDMVQRNLFFYQTLFDLWGRISKVNSRCAHYRCTLSEIYKWNRNRAVLKPKLATTVVHGFLDLWLELWRSCSLDEIALTDCGSPVCMSLVSIPGGRWSNEWEPIFSRELSTSDPVLV